MMCIVVGQDLLEGILFDTVTLLSAEIIIAKVISSVHFVLCFETVFTALRKQHFSLPIRFLLKWCRTAIRKQKFQHA